RDRLFRCTFDALRPTVDAAMSRVEHDREFVTVARIGFVHRDFAGARGSDRRRSQVAAQLRLELLAAGRRKIGDQAAAFAVLVFKHFYPIDQKRPGHGQDESGTIALDIAVTRVGDETLRFEFAWVE